MPGACPRSFASAADVGQKHGSRSMPHCRAKLFDSTHSTNINTRIWFHYNVAYLYHCCWNTKLVVNVPIVCWFQFFFKKINLKSIIFLQHTPVEAVGGSNNFNTAGFCFEAKSKGLQTLHESMKTFLCLKKKRI